MSVFVNIKKHLLSLFSFLKGAIVMKKRPDGRYKVSLTIDGKRHYFYGRTIKEAEQRRDKFKNALHAAPNVDYTITLGQWLSIWLRGARSTQLIYI